jgi:hypothetical protein
MHVVGDKTLVEDLRIAEFSLRIDLEQRRRHNAARQRIKEECRAVWEKESRQANLESIDPRKGCIIGKMLALNESSLAEKRITQRPRLFRNDLMKGFF